MSIRIVQDIASLVLKKRLPVIEDFMNKPWQVQEQVFKTLIESAQNTQFGTQHHFSSIKTVKDFQEKVPIRTYEEFYPYIEKTLKGEKNILWKGKTKWFAKSSGTTNDISKFIPVTKESMQDCHFQAGKDMLALYFDQFPESEIFTGRALSIGGSHEVSKFNKDANYGDLSAVLIENMPVFFELFRTPNKKVALMSEWESKLNKMAEQTAKQNVTSIVGVPTWTIVLIKKIFENTGKTDVKEIWPNLEAFFHGGVSFKPYKTQFEKLIPHSAMRYVETYNASEGFFGIQNKLGQDDMLLMLDYGIFYEFIPMNEFYSENPPALTIDEVETGVNYAVVISTNAGLFRYVIGDTIMFTSTDPYKVKVSGRTKHFINAFGEELVVENANVAIGKACLKTNAIIENYTAAPVYFSGEENGTHEWIIEFEKDPDSFDVFCEILDETLKTVNSDYAAKRYKNLALKFPIFHYAPQGTFYDWMKSRGKLGGQNKVPRLSNSREYIESIKKLIN